MTSTSTRRLAQALPIGLIALLLATIVGPIAALLLKSLMDRQGQFIGLGNFARYVAEPGLSVAIWNSVSLSSVSTILTIAIAFPYAYALHRSQIPAKGLFRVIMLVPLLAPSMLPAFGMIYLFGNQGVLKSWLMGHAIYGSIGIVSASVFHALPHAVLILSAGLASGDQRIYEAARALKASPLKTFTNVTLPSCQYAIISAACVVFVIVFTDFGIPTVIGGSINVLATDIYKQVIGRFDFELGAVVGMLLLIPALVAYLVDVMARRNQRATFSGRSVPVEPGASRGRDAALLGFVVVVGICILGIIGMALFGSLVRFWPYNLTLGLHHYEKAMSDPDELRSLVNSLVLASSTAIAGTLLVVLSGWMVSRKVFAAGMTQTLQALAMVPVAVPGLVLGLGYVFFFNNPANPLHILQGSMILLVLCTIAHFYTVPHLMAVGGLVKLDRETDLAAQALRSGPVATGRRIHIPVLGPTLVDIAGYLFVNAMTTVSALMFLFNAQTRVAAVAVVNMTEGSRFGQATALAVLVMAVCLLATALQMMARTLIVRRQTWRRPAS
ncbi:MAG: putative 2-aminoethylphosphonate ABC transporter permease subunit [Hyphomicrobiales bacterium]|nr:putative 2-aminoethylphosphonate ABC transporter permease subunit [Hyphomicrobiales bacterium]